MKPKDPYRRKHARAPKNRLFDFRRLRVLAMHATETGSMITLSLTASDQILVGVAISEAMAVDAMPAGAVVRKPVVEQDGQPALVVHVMTPPAGLAVGRLVNLAMVLSSELDGDTYVISAAASAIRLRSDRENGMAPITLPAVGSRPVLTDEELNLRGGPGAQMRAEAYLKAAYAYRLREEAKAHEAAVRAAAVRLMPGPTVHVEVPDEAVALISPTDQLDATDTAILAEMQRIAAMGLPRWMRPDGEAAA